MALAYKEDYQSRLVTVESPVKGAGIIVVDPKGQKILIVEEHKPKDQTDREVDQLSIPLETAKYRRRGSGQESHGHTLMGAFTEVANDNTLAYMQQNLREVELTGPNVVELKPGISALLAVFVYHGELDNDIWNPSAEQETANPKWMNITEFLGDEKIRSFAHTAVTFAQEQGYLNPLSLGRTRRRSLYHHITSLENYSRNRERASRDVIPA